MRPAEPTDDLHLQLLRCSPRVVNNAVREADIIRGARRSQECLIEYGVRSRVSGVQTYRKTPLVGHAAEDIASAITDKSISVHIPTSEITSFKPTIGEDVGLQTAC
jgi:hypothetical protein